MHTEAMGGPPRVQIQTKSGCNGRCVFCPNQAAAQAGLPTGEMSFELFEDIVDDLARTPPRRVLPYLQNEPLMDKRLPEFVDYLSERLPQTTSLVVTNGTRLTEEMGAGLLDAGLKRLKVSLQSLDDTTNTAIMGHPASGVVEKVLGFKRVLRKKRSKLDLRVSMVVNSHNAHDIEATRRFWHKNGIRLVTSALENRGGNIADAESLNAGSPMAHCGDCVRPSRDLCVLHDGRVILCCVDWFQTAVMGDLKQSSVHTVWNGEEYTRARTALREEDVAGLPAICADCTESACPDAHRRGPWKQFKHALFAPFLGGEG